MKMLALLSRARSRLNFDALYDIAMGDADSTGGAAERAVLQEAQKCFLTDPHRIEDVFVSLANADGIDIFHFAGPVTDWVDDTDEIDMSTMLDLLTRGPAIRPGKAGLPAICAQIGDQSPTISYGSCGADAFDNGQNHIRSIVAVARQMMEGSDVIESLTQ